MTDKEIIMELERMGAEHESDFSNEVLCLIKWQKERIEDLEILTGVMRKRKYYNKFVKEVWQKERGKLSYPDFDEIYKRYFDQQAEIEKLKNENQILNQKRENIFEIANAHERGYIKAIKDFADRLKEKSWDADTRCGYVQVVDIGDINDIAEEMTGRGDEMTVRELIQNLLVVTNQNKEVQIRDVIETKNSFYSSSKPINDVKEYNDKVVIK